MRDAVKSLIRKGYIVVRNTSIFARLFVSSLLLILVPAIIILGFLYRNVEKSFYESGMSYIYQNLDNTVQKAYEDFRIYETKMEALAGDEQLLLLLGRKNGLEKGKAIGEWLEEKKTRIECENLFLITPEEVYSVRRIQAPVLADEKAFRDSEVYRESLRSGTKTNWFNTIRDNSTYYTNAKKNSWMGNYLTLTCQLGTGVGNGSMLVANIDIARLSALADIDKVYNQDLYLVDKDGMITYMNMDYVYRDYPQEIWKEAVRHPEDVTECEVEGKPAVIAVEKLGKSDWYVASIILKENLLYASYRLKRQLLIVVAVTVLISLLISSIVTISISHPLKRIMEAMKQYARKDFNLELKDVGNDQITSVSRHFGEMSRRIGELVQEEIEAETRISEEKLKQREMKLNALQLQINPHFLYNTLDLIRWNVVRLEKGNDRVSRMIGSYSSLLRYNIRLGEGYATVAEEIEYTKKYIKLLNMLYDINIRVEVDNHGVRLEDIRIGKLFFQPIVENAMIHGKLNLARDPFLKIEITQGEKMWISIYNNGLLMKPEKMEQLNREFETAVNESLRVGLFNINQRIRLLFGEKYGLSVAEKDGMVCFTISLPLTVVEGEKRDVPVIDCR